jgi:hypothetical protein
MINEILFFNGINTMHGGAGKNSLTLWKNDLVLHNFKVNFFHTSHYNLGLRNILIIFLRHIPGVFFRIFYKIPLFEYFYKISFADSLFYIYLQFKKKKDLIFLSHHSTFYLIFFSYFNKPVIIIHDLIYFKAKNQDSSRFFCKLTFKLEAFFLKRARFILVQSFKEKRILDHFFKGSIKIYLVKSISSSFSEVAFEKRDNTIALVADWRRIENIHGVRSFFKKSGYRYISNKNICINVWGYGSSLVCSYLEKTLKGQNFIVQDRGAFQSSNEITDKFLLVPIYHGSGIKIKILEAIFDHRVIITTPKGIEGLFRIKSKVINVINSFSQFVELFLSLSFEKYKESDFTQFQKKYDLYFHDISSVMLNYEK